MASIRDHLQIAWLSMTPIPEQSDPLMLLAIIGLAAGLAGCGAVGGAWFAWRRRSASNAGEVQADRMLDLMGSLKSWTHGFAGDVSNFQTRVGELMKMIDQPGGGLENEATRLETNEGLIALLAEMANAHEALQLRLHEAEQSLDEKQQEVSAYLSEARTDGLTQVPNRRAFDDEIARRFSEWQRYRSVISVMLIDIDHFKSFNDTHGHQVGDAVLVQVAATLKKLFRDSDMVARFGGEEFAAILPSASMNEAAAAASRCVRAVRDRVYEHEGKTFGVTVSCGVAQTVDDDSVTTLIRRADAALYAAKNAGRDRAALHNGEVCLPISLDRSPLLADPDVPARFVHVCDSLREKLIEITRGS